MNEGITEREKEIQTGKEVIKEVRERSEMIKKRRK